MMEGSNGTSAYGVVEEPKEIGESPNNSLSPEPIKPEYVST